MILEIKQQKQTLFYEYKLTIYASSNMYRTSTGNYFIIRYIDVYAAGQFVMVKSSSTRGFEVQFN